MSNETGTAAQHPVAAAPAAELVIDYLLTHYGTKLEQFNRPQGRVWQLNAVVDANLRNKHDLCNEIEKLREENQSLHALVQESRKERIAADVVRGVAENERNVLMARCKALMEQLGCISPAIVGVYTRRGLTLRRTLRLLAVQSADGKTTIEVDLRKPGRD